MSPIARLLMLPLFGGALLAGASAQTILKWDGAQPNERMGAALDTVADLDLDGVDDVVMSAPHAAGSAYQSGTVHVFSGASGTRLFTLQGDAALDHAGLAVAGLGDLNGDGRGDFAVGHRDSDQSANGAGMVRVHSGANAGVLFEWYGLLAFEGFGASVASAGDADGDGADDVLVGAWRSGLIAGRVELRSGASGALLRSHLGTSAEDRLGWSVSGVGDVDGDGRDDYGLGAIQEGYGPGYVRIHSGSSGGLIRQHSGLADFENFGAAICGLGDVNGDGRADYAVGANAGAVDQLRAGRVDVFSGQDGARLWSIDGTVDLERFGDALDGGLDFSGDGVGDLVVGAPNGAGWRGRVVILSGVDGTTLRQWIGSKFGDGFGGAVAQSRDLGVDGRPDVLIGAPGEDVALAGEGVGRAISGASGCQTYTYCTAKPSSTGCEPSMGWSGSPALSGPDDFEIHGARLPVDTTGVFVWSSQSSIRPLLGGTLCVAPPLGRSPPLETGSLPDACGGRMSLPMSAAFIDDQGWTPGTTIHVQAWIRDTGQVDGTQASSSDGLAFVLCL